VVGTKQVVQEATKALMAATPEDGVPSPIGLNKFSMAVVNQMVETFGGSMNTLNGLVAIGYAAARFAAASVVQTVQTREDLQKQLQIIGELIAVTTKMGIDAAWTHAQNPTKEEPLIVTVPVTGTQA
jgi:hypothetical protein